MTRTRLLSLNAAAGTTLAAVLLALGPASAAAASTAKPPVAPKTTRAQLRVTSQITTGSGSEVLRPAGVLSASNAAGPVSLTDVAIANGTLVATGSQFEPPSSEILVPQDLYVYSKPAAGWQVAQDPVTYQPANSETASGHAIGDGFIATEECTAGEGCGSGEYDIAILTRQEGSDQLSAAAQLAIGQESIVADGPEGVMAAGGDTVVTGTARGPLHVFTEPTGGWSGTVTETAKIPIADAFQLDEAGAVASCARNFCFRASSKRGSGRRGRNRDVVVLDQSCEVHWAR